MCIRTVTYMCRKGHYYSEQPPPGIQSNTGWCHPCSDGSFMDSEEHKERQCRPCRKCTGGPNEYYKRQCDQITDSECALCPPGQQAAPDGLCLSPTTKSSVDPTTTSASTTNAETTAKTASVAAVTSSETRDATTSNESTHSEWSQLLQAATKGSDNDGGLMLLRSSHWHVYNQTNASASQDDDDSSSVVRSTTASSAIAFDESLKAATPFTMTVNDIPLDARVTALAVMSVTSTVALVAILALWLKRRDRERHGSSRAKICCCSCALSSHLYHEPMGDDEVSYLEPLPQSDSGRSSASISAASDGESHTYDYVQPFGFCHPAANCRVNSLLLNGGRGSHGERLLCQLPASDSEQRHSGEPCCTLRHSQAAFCQAPPSEVTHVRCDVEMVLNDTSCNANSHSTEKSAIGCGDSCCTKCGQPPHCHKAIVQHAHTSACDRIYDEID